MSEKTKNEDQKFHEEDFEEVKVEPVEPEEPEEPADEENEPESDYSEDDSETSTIVEKFMDYELQTKAGLISTLLILLGLIFRWYWINANWWLVLIIGAIGVKTLYSQMTDLEEEKPAEAKIAKYTFFTLITLLVIRDLWITSYFSDLIRFLPVK